MSYILPEHFGFDTSVTTLYAKGVQVYGCGFVFAEPFDVLLRRLNEAYLEAAWKNLSGLLTELSLPQDDISWGWLHSGVSALLPHPLFPDYYFPSNYTGWVSENLDSCLSSASGGVLLKVVDAKLSSLTPPLRCTCSYRTLKWPVMPTDYATALQLTEAIWAEESSDWNPENILRPRWRPSFEPVPDRNVRGLWGQLAEALLDQDIILYKQLLKVAKTEYTPTGYGVVEKGFRMFENYDFTQQ